MDTNTIKEYNAFAQKLLKEAGKRIADTLNDSLTVETKANRSDLVTNMDISTQRFIIESLAAQYPDHHFLGEEEDKGKVAKMQGCVWILDPIDGTQNFVCLRRDFAISLALFIDNVGVLGYVYDLMRNELYTAMRGEGAALNGKPLKPVSVDNTFENSLLITEINSFNKFEFVRECAEEAISVRMMGCCALETINVITGRAAAYLNGAGVKVWDIAGAVVIANEMGVNLTRFDGSELSMLEAPVTLIAARSEMHQYLLEKYLAKQIK